MRNPIRSKVTSIVNRSLDPQEWFWVQFRIPPPLKLAKTLSLHFDQPRQAPSLAGFFTSAFGLCRPPRGPIFAFLAPFSPPFFFSLPPPQPPTPPPRGLILAFLARFPSLFLYSLRTRKRPSPQGRVLQNQ